MSPRFIAFTAAGALALGLAGGWGANGWRLGLQIKSLELKQTQSQLSGANTTIARMGAFQEGFNDALQRFQQTQRANEAAGAGLNRTLLDLRGVTTGLRGDFADLPNRIAAASEPALREYAATCSAVLDRMGGAGERMANGGAGIARKAEGHAADVKLLQDVEKSR